MHADVPLRLRVRVLEGRGFPSSAGVALLSPEHEPPRGAYYLSCEFNGELQETSAEARPRWDAGGGTLEWRLGHRQLRRVLAAGGQAKLVCWLRRGAAAWEQLGWLVLDMKSARGNAERAAAVEAEADADQAGNTEGGASSAQRTRVGATANIEGRWFPLTGSGRCGAALAQVRVFHTLEEDYSALGAAQRAEAAVSEDNVLSEAERSAASEAHEPVGAASLEALPASLEAPLGSPVFSTARRAKEVTAAPALGDQVEIEDVNATDLELLAGLDVSEQSEAAAVAHEPAPMTAVTGAEAAEAAIVRALDEARDEAAAAIQEALDSGPKGVPQQPLPEPHSPVVEHQQHKQSRLPAPGFMSSSVGAALAALYQDTVAMAAGENGADDSFHAEATPRVQQPPEAFASQLCGAGEAPPPPVFLASPAASPPQTEGAAEAEAAAAEVATIAPLVAAAVEVRGSAEVGGDELAGLRESAAGALEAVPTLGLAVEEPLEASAEGDRQSQVGPEPSSSATELPTGAHGQPELDAAPGPPVSLLPAAGELPSAAIVPDEPVAGGAGEGPSDAAAGADELPLAFTFSVAIPSFRASRKLPMAAAKVYTRIMLPPGVVGKGKAPVRSAPPADCPRGAQTSLPNAAASVTFDSTVVAVAQAIVQEQSMRVEVWHRDSHRADSMLGVASVSLQPLLTAARAEGAAAVLANDKGRAVEVGKLHVALSLDAAPTAAPPAEPHKPKAKKLKAAATNRAPAKARPPKPYPSVDALPVPPTAAALEAADAAVAQLAASTIPAIPPQATPVQAPLAAPPAAAPQPGAGAADFNVAWELEMWKDAEMARFTAAMRERELARLDALETAWRQGAETAEVDIAARRAAAADMERDARAALDRAEVQERSATAAAEAAQLRHDAAEREMHARIAESTAATKRVKAEAASAVDIQMSIADEANRLREAAQAQLAAERARYGALEREFDDYRAKQRATPEVALRAEVACLRERLAETERKLDVSVRAKRRYKAHLRTVVLELGRTQQKVVAQERLKLRDLQAHADVERIAGMAGRHADGLEAERTELGDMRQRLQSLRTAIEGTLADDADSRAAAVAATVAASHGETQLPTAADAVAAVFGGTMTAKAGTDSEPPPSAPPSAAPPPSAPREAEPAPEITAYADTLEEAAEVAAVLCFDVAGEGPQERPLDAEADAEAAAAPLAQATGEEATTGALQDDTGSAPVEAETEMLGKAESAEASADGDEAAEPSWPAEAVSAEGEAQLSHSNARPEASAADFPPLRGRAAAREAIRLMRERSALLATGAYANDDPLIVELEGKIADLSSSAESAGGISRSGGAAQRGLRTASAMTHQQKPIAVA